MACRASGLARFEAEDLAVSMEQRWADALNECYDAAEESLRERAIDGWEEPVHYQGGPVWKLHPLTGEQLLDDNFEPIPYTVRKRSDTLLVKYLEANRPRKFHRGKEDALDERTRARLRPKDSMDLSNLTAEERSQLRAMLDRAEPQKLLEAPGGSES